MFGFSADLSWTDANDQLNKDKREQQQRQRAESRATQHSHSDSSSLKSVKPLRSDGSFRSKSKFSLFRAKSRNGEAQRDTHSSAGSYMTNWTNGWSAESTNGPKTPPPVSPQSRPIGMAISPPILAPNQLAHDEYTPQPLFSNQYGYSAFAEVEKRRANYGAFGLREDLGPPLETLQQPKYFKEPKTLRKMHSRGPMRPPPAIPESPILKNSQSESHDQLSPLNNARSVVKSVTIAVQYSPSSKIEPLNQPKPWSQEHTRPTRCHEISGMASLSLAGKKCAINADGDGKHSAKCFLNLVKAMKKADGPIALDFLRVHGCSADSGVMEEMRLERLLWISTLLNNKVFRGLWSPGGKEAKMSYDKIDILDLDGDIGDLYATSTYYPTSQITHLTSFQTAKSQALLPSFVTQTLLTLSTTSSPLLPFVAASMSQITITRPSSLLPAAQLPTLLADCFRVLKPGGMLKIRLMDVFPDRGSAGPKVSEWIETNVIERLESEFRCARPGTLVPKWVKTAGFNIPYEGGERKLKLSAAIEQEIDDVAGSLGEVVCREMWNRTWGAFIDMEKRWWEESEVLDECVSFNTTWTITALSAVKPRA